MASRIMATVGPAAELMRINRPVGILNIFFPYMYGFFYVLLVTDPSPPLRWTLGYQFPILFFSAFVLRSVGCVWNDIVDADVDKLVSRTRTRPLPRGAISLRAANGVAVALFGVWIGALTLLMPDSMQLAAYATPLTAMVIGYPYMKRVTNYAQVFLGFTLAWGVFFGAAIAGFDVLAHVTDNIDNLTSALVDARVCGLIALHLVYVTWSVIHDTIYAFQDYKDDKLAGLKSMAQTLSGNTKPVLWTLSEVQVTLLIAACVASVPESQPLLSTGPLSLAMRALQWRWIFLAVAVLGNAIILSLMVGKVDLSNPQSCAKWFKTGSVWVGSTIGIGFLLEYVWQMM